MIALIFCGDLKYCPYIRRYVERLEKMNVQYQVYFWNRSGIELNLGKNYVYFNSTSNMSKNKFLKFIDFVKFRFWLIKKLKEVNPKKIIALSTLTGVFLGKFLCSLKGKYIFDVRDYSYEHLSFFSKIERRIILNSCFTAISSRGFLEFLPKEKYVIAHNFNRLDVKQNTTFKPTKGKINFVWNGVIRYFNYQIRYLNALKNDSRFELIFHGDGPELDLFKEYCKNNRINNVLFTGAYDNFDKKTLLENAHILNNCYGYVEDKDASRKVKYAVSNRFYDGIAFHIPQVVEPFGFKTDWVAKSGVGVSFFPDEHFADNLYNYYKSIDARKFDAACDKVLNEVLAEDDEYVSKIDEFIKK